MPRTTTFIINSGLEQLNLIYYFDCAFFSLIGSICRGLAQNFLLDVIMAFGTSWSLYGIFGGFSQAAIL